MQEEFKGYDCLKTRFEKYPEFKQMVLEQIALGNVRYFNDEEWDKIKEQNYMSRSPQIKNFYDIFLLGGNEGNCTGCSKQLSYSYDGIAIAGGVLPILIGTRNCSDGSHTWLETSSHIIDTSLLLVIDKKLKDKFGYQTEIMYDWDILCKDRMYMCRKEFTNDQSIKKI